MSESRTSSFKKALSGILITICRDWINLLYKFKHLEEHELSVIYSCSVKIVFSLVMNIVTKQPAEVSHKLSSHTVSSLNRRKIFTTPIEWQERFSQEEYQFLMSNPIQQKTVVNLFHSLFEFIYGKEDIQKITVNDFTYLDWIELYEFLLGYRLLFESGGYLLKKVSVEKRREGKFYTPELIINHMIESTLEPLCRDKTVEEILSLRILDPAMGCGQFLSSAARYLYKTVIEKQSNTKTLFSAIPSETVLNLIISNCLYGVDRDPFAVFLSRWILHKQSTIDTIGTGCLVNHLKVGDSLIGSIRIKENDTANNLKCLTSFNWYEAFPEIFHKDSKSEQSVGFDVVIGNPPWISFGLRGMGKLTKDELAYYRIQYPDSAEYKISSYALFMERAVKLLAPGGFHSFIVPDSFLNGRYFSRIRKYFLEKTNIIKILLLDQKVWKGIHAGRYVIYLVRKSQEGEDKKTQRFSKESGKVAPAVFESIFIKDSKDLKKSLHGFNQNVLFFLNRFPYRFRLVFDQPTASFLDKVERNSIPLGKLLKFYSGLIGKKGKASIVHSTLPSAGTEISPLIESGECLDKYKLMYHGFYILKDKNLYKSGYSPEIYENQKVFLNQTGYRLKAYLDSDGYYCLNNLHAGYSINSQYSLSFLTAILNSQIIEKYYHTISMEYKRPLAQIDIDMLETLPIPEISFLLSSEERLKWIESLPFLKAHYKVKSLREATRWQSNIDTEFKKISDRKKTPNTQIIDMRQNYDYQDNYFAKSDDNYEMIRRAIKDVKNSTSEYRTVLHDWIHIYSYLLMELYREKTSYYESNIIKCDLPNGINGFFYCEINKNRDFMITIVRKSIEEIVKILYGI